MNWKEMKDFCSKLTEEQLDQKVILWREDEAITKIECSQLEHDHYIETESGSPDGCFEESEALYMIKNHPEDYPNGLDHFTKVYDKGFPILKEDF